MSLAAWIRRGGPNRGIQICAGNGVSNPEIFVYAEQGQAHGSAEIANSLVRYSFYGSNTALSQKRDKRPPFSNFAGAHASCEVQLFPDGDRPPRESGNVYRVICMAVSHLLSPLTKCGDPRTAIDCRRAPRPISHIMSATVYGTATYSAKTGH